MEELKEQKPQNERVKKPKWLRVKLPTGKEYREVRDVVSEHKLHTICESGNCPNMGECWGAGTATFMILGNVCTRSCGFCAVSTGKPAEAEMVYREDLKSFPANGWSLLGLQQSLDAQEKSDEALVTGAQFETAWQFADVTLESSRF